MSAGEEINMHAAEKVINKVDLVKKLHIFIESKQGIGCLSHSDECQALVEKPARLEEQRYTRRELNAPNRGFPVSIFIRHGGKNAKWKKQISAGRRKLLE